MATTQWRLKMTTTLRLLTTIYSIAFLSNPVGSLPFLIVSRDKPTITRPSINFYYRHADFVCLVQSTNSTWPSPISTLQTASQSINQAIIFIKRKRFHHLHHLSSSITVHTHRLADPGIYHAKRQKPPSPAFVVLDPPVVTDTTKLAFRVFSVLLPAISFVHKNSLTL